LEILVLPPPLNDMNNRKILFALISCIFFADCSRENFFEATLNVCNKSSKDIALYLGFDPVIPPSDATLKKNIASGESCTLVGSGNSLKGLLDDTGHDHITILVFDDLLQLVWYFFCSKGE